jgi:hypothetical protein
LLRAPSVTRVNVFFSFLRVFLFLSYYYYCASQGNYVHAIEARYIKKCVEERNDRNQVTAQHYSRLSE